MCRECQWARTVNNSWLFICCILLSISDIWTYECSGEYWRDGVCQPNKWINSWEHARCEWHDAVEEVEHSQDDSYDDRSIHFWQLQPDYKGYILKCFLFYCWSRFQKQCFCSITTVEYSRQDLCWKRRLFFILRLF